MGKSGNMERFVQGASIMRDEIEAQKLRPLVAGHSVSESVGAGVGEIWAYGGCGGSCNSPWSCKKSM